MKGVDDQMAELRRRVHSHMVGRLAIALKILRSCFFLFVFSVEPELRSSMKVVSVMMP